MTRLAAVFFVFLACMHSNLSAQVQPNQQFHDQNVSVDLFYDQSATPTVQGGVSYSKLIDKDHGIYSYTRIHETSITLKPTPVIQTQTETGVCVYTTKFGVFDVFLCGSGGIATASSSVGLSGTGLGMAVTPLKNGWWIGLAGGPSYSAVDKGKTTYSLGLVAGWGR